MTIPVRVMLIGIAVALASCDSKPAPAESAAERDAAVGEAFLNTTGGEPVVDPAIHREVATFFTALGKAFLHGDVSTIRRHFSSEKLIESAEARGLIDIPGGSRRSEFLRGFDVGFQQSMGQWSEAMGWHQQEIRKIARLDTDTLLVYARFWDDELEVHTKSRWWLSRIDGEWRAFDWEDFDQNMRVSTLMGSMFGAVTSKAAWLSSFQAMMQAYSAANATGDMVSALTDIQPKIDQLLTHRNLPMAIETMARTLRSGGFVVMEEFEKALVELDRIEKLDGGNPLVHYQRGVARSGLEQWDLAIESFEKYAETLGWDADVHELVSDAYYGKGDVPQAISHAEKGLADQPNSWGCLSSIAIALPLDRLEELVPHFSKLEDAESAYLTVIDYAVASEDETKARALLQQFERAYAQSEYLEECRDMVESLRTGETDDKNP